MRGRPWVKQWLAALMTLLLALPGLEAWAAGGSIRGTLLSAADQAPMRGLTVFAADTATGGVYSSGPSTETGAFEIAGLPGSTFELAVGDAQSLYLVSSPVVLGPDQARQVSLAVGEARPATPAGVVDVTRGTRAAAPRPNVWNNPLTASLIVVGSAIAVGAFINAATDDEDDASPVAPANPPAN